jgi:hypothetical protein
VYFATAPATGRRVLAIGVADGEAQVFLDGARVGTVSDPSLRATAQVGVAAAG